MIDKIFLLSNLDSLSSWNLTGRIPVPGTDFGLSVRVFLTSAEYRVPIYVSLYLSILKIFILIINYFNFNKMNIIKNMNKSEEATVDFRHNKRTTKSISA